MARARDAAAMRRRAATLEKLMAERTSLVMDVCRHFSKLTWEDAEDLVAEALAEVAEDLPESLPEARAYVRRVIRHDAIDEIRRREGRRPSEKAARPRRVGWDDARADTVIADAGSVDGDLLDAEERLVARRTVARLLDSLAEPEAAVLRLRYLDGLEPDEACAQLGVSRTQYERRLTRANRTAVEWLLRDAPTTTCEDVRAAVASDAALSAEAAGRRDAHLEECLACRAHVRRRSGLLSLVPLPMLTWATALRARLDAWMDGAGPAGEGAALGGGAAGLAGGSSAGTLLGGSAVLKVAAACSGAAVLAVCAPVPSPPESPQRPARSATAATAKAHALPGSATTSAVATPPSAAPPRPAATATPDRSPGSRAEGPIPVAKPMPARRTAARPTRAQDAARREFGFEDPTAAPATPPPATTLVPTRAGTATAPSSTPAPATTPASFERKAPAPVPSQGARSGSAPACTVGFERC